MDEQKQQDNGLSAMESFAQLLAKLDELKPKPPLERKSVVTFGAAPFTYYGYGFDYWTIYVSSQQTLNVEAMGMTFTVDLTPGWNLVTIPGESALTSDTDFPALCIWTDRPGNAAANIRNAPALGDNVGQDLSLPVSAYNAMYNGSTWDRMQNNVEGVALASAARTATTASPTFTNTNAKGIQVTLDISAASGTGGLQVRIQGVDPASGNVYSLNGAPTAITATGTYTYEFYPGATTGGIPASNNVNARYATGLPRSWRVNVQAGDATSYTYSVGYSLIN